MTVTFYDTQEFREITVKNVAVLKIGLAKTAAGGRRAKVWICADNAGGAAAFRQTRYEIRKIGG